MVYKKLLQKVSNINEHEIGAVVWSFLYFFFLLTSYYILRPIRDDMGIVGGVENLQWLFTATFFAMLALVPAFGWISSRFSRKLFLPYVYYFFIFNILVFYLLIASHTESVIIARVFFVWVSVFNLFVVSVFWSFMTDIFNDEQSKRLFAFIAAGGTTGALTGPVITALLLGYINTENLLLISALLLTFAVLCIRKITSCSAHLSNSFDNQQSDSGYSTYTTQNDVTIGGHIFEGITLVLKSPYLMGICFLMLLFTMLATFLYFQQASIISEFSSDSATRTRIFALIDFSVNSLTLIFQLFITAKFVKYFGLHWTLAIIPIALAVGFVSLSVAPVIGVIIVVQVIRRAGNYAIMRPAREMLYVVLDRQSKYKAKNFIDTTVYRGGDAISSWIYTGFISLGFSLSIISIIAIPISLIWASLAYSLGRQHDKIAASSSTPTERKEN